MEKAIKDSRILCFNKWVLPKSTSLSIAQGFDAITVGYFDSINVKQINVKTNKNKFSNPLTDFINQKEQYNNQLLNKYKKGLTDDVIFAEQKNFSIQQLMIFTNIGLEDINKCVYDETKVKKFWKNSSGLRFYSLLHIEQGFSEEKIYEIIKIINEQFRQCNGDNSYKAICYFSLDYSDIVICAKDVSVSDFSRIIFKINFDNDKKLIRDSFSVLCIERWIFEIVFETLEENKDIDFTQLINHLISKCLKGTAYAILKNDYNIAFNIGVQNNEVFKLFLTEVKKCRLIDEHQIFKILGRHDISIVNENANLLWLIAMMYFIDKFSTISEKNKDAQLDMKSVLFNCETYIRIKASFQELNNYNDEELLQKNKWHLGTNDINKARIYKNARIIIDYEINECLNKKIKNKYATSIWTLRNSILGLLKNGFAEDFVLCIFESFISFLRYIKNNYACSSEFDVCFDNYFNIISAIANSAMHSERQFIQSPSFNPVFYDVPPKLMAFYTALTSDINSIIKTEKGHDYSFVFKPSFLEDIKVNSYSQRKLPPADRLLYVTIREKDFYYPYSVVSQMCHEIAHYVGGENRNRKERKERYLKSVLYYILYEHFREDGIKAKFETNISKWLNELFAHINSLTYYKDCEGFSDSYKHLVFYSLFHIYESDYIEQINKEYLFDKDLLEMDLVSLNRGFKNYILRCIEDILLENSVLWKKIELISDLFHEDYADVQMIMVLGMDLRKYLKTFEVYFNETAKKTKKTLEETVHNDLRVYGRILSVVMLFTLKEYWEVEEAKENELLTIIYKDINAFVCYINGFKNDKKNMYNSDVYKVIAQLKKYGLSHWSFHEYVIANVQKYLIKVYDTSSKHYKTKEISINELREKIKTIDNFDNAVEVFSKIQSTNDEYSRKIFRLDEELDDI